MKTLIPFFDRDISWLSFNGSVLEQAAKEDVPLLERIKFMAIFSSNLDEFYRVRIPALKIIFKNKYAKRSVLTKIKEIINEQQEYFGSLLNSIIIPDLRRNNISLIYNQKIPEEILPQIRFYFYTTIAAYIQVIYSEKSENLFFENDRLYLLVHLKNDSEDSVAILTVPSHTISRFFLTEYGNTTFIVFIEDIIKHFLPIFFREYQYRQAYSIKVTRNADLNIQNEYNGDIAQNIESQLANRDFGFATRLLHSPDIPISVLNNIVKYTNIDNTIITNGGHYHNLKDFFSFPINNPALRYPPQAHISPHIPAKGILEHLEDKDMLIHTPFMAYDPILWFFTEAAIHPHVTEIYTTIYRVASDSKVAHALTNAAKNGKKVTVFVELKARFDEANNIKWAKVMRAAGVHIIYSIPLLKVHAKVTLVKRQDGEKERFYGLLSTGNFNENTAKTYTDHTLMTSRPPLVGELAQLFTFLSKRRKPMPEETGLFKTLLVAQFNLKNEFIRLVDREIQHAKDGLPSHIRIKINSLEEEAMINKLYEASTAGVTVDLVIRGICRLQPGVKGISENITVRRIVDRYLEHGRIFIFENSGFPDIYMGSADWMKRNIHSRIEICFPIPDGNLQREIISIFDMYWKDNVSAVEITKNLEALPVANEGPPFRAQHEIYSYLKSTTV